MKKRVAHLWRHTPSQAPATPLHVLLAGKKKTFSSKEKKEQQCTFDIAADRWGNCMYACCDLVATSCAAHNGAWTTRYQKPTFSCPVNAFLDPKKSGNTAGNTTAEKQNNCCSHLCPGPVTLTKSPTKAPTVFSSGNSVSPAIGSAMAMVVLSMISARF